MYLGHGGVSDRLLDALLDACRSQKIPTRSMMYACICKQGKDRAGKGQEGGGHPRALASVAAHSDEML